MARRKNVKRIDPRYFLNETVNRGEETLVEEDVPAWFSVPDSTKRRIARHDAEDRADKRQRDDTARRRQGVKDDIEMDKWKNRDRTHSQEHGEIEEGTPPLQEREGETAEDVAARLKSMPASFRGSAVNDFLNMRDGSTEMARHYPHVQDLAAFASDVLELLGES